MIAIYILMPFLGPRFGYVSNSWHKTLAATTDIMVKARAGILCSPSSGLALDPMDITHLRSLYSCSRRNFRRNVSSSPSAQACSASQASSSACGPLRDQSEAVYNNLPCSAHAHDGHRANCHIRMPICCCQLWHPLQFLRRRPLQFRHCLRL